MDINLYAGAAGLAGQYAGAMLPTLLPITGFAEPMYLEHAGVGIGTAVVTGDYVTGGMAALLDHGLMVLYNAMPALQILSPVRGGIAAMGTIMLRQQLGV